MVITLKLTGMLRMKKQFMMCHNVSPESLLNKLLKTKI